MKTTLLPNLTSKTPMPATLQEVYDMVKNDKNVECNTHSYRVTRARTYKDSSPSFSPACIFQGGKAAGNVVALTGMGMVDLDHLPLDQVEPLRTKVIADPHTLLCHATISGEGLRILFRYETIPGEPYDRQKQYYEKSVFPAANEYYRQLTGAQPDLQCKNVTRLSVIAHDPLAYLNAEAESFSRQWVHQQIESRREQERRQRQLLRQQQSRKAKLDSLFAETLAPEIEGEGAVYESGRHNDYIMRLGYKLNQFGIALDDATEWAVEKFTDYGDTAQVFRSCYQNTADHGTRKPSSRRKKSTDGDVNDPLPYATVADIMAFLDDTIRLRHNKVTARVEWAPLGNDPNVKWEMVCDRTVNSLWTKLSEQLRVRADDIYRIISSDFVPLYDPFLDYLESLPEWDATTQPDYIHQLAQTITVKGGEKEQLLMERYLKKWLVAMIASWINVEVVNNVIFVLIGPQGIFKTTWFNYLLPPELRSYFHSKTDSRRMNRDDLLSLTQHGLVCCEELDTMSPKELNQLKAVVTTQYINERAAYAHFAEQRPHLASFCGTGNNAQFLTDPTGNRRWLPFEVESILSPWDHPFDYHGIYSQAYTLLKQGFVYWFTLSEVKEVNTRNRRYETPSLEKELVELYFRKPEGEEVGQFMTTARIIQMIGTGVTQKINAVNVGRALSDLGFKRKRNEYVRGFIVMPRTAEEMLVHQKMQARYATNDEFSADTSDTSDT